MGVQDVFDQSLPLFLTWWKIFVCLQRLLLTLIAYIVEEVCKKHPQITEKHVLMQRSCSDIVEVAWIPLHGKFRMKLFSSRLNNYKKPVNVQLPNYEKVKIILKIIAAYSFALNNISCNRKYFQNNTVRRRLWVTKKEATSIKEAGLRRKRSKYEWQLKL